VRDRLIRSIGGLQSVLRSVVGRIRATVRRGWRRIRPAPRQSASAGLRVSPQLRLGKKTAADANLFVRRVLDRLIEAAGV